MHIVIFSPDSWSVFFPGSGYVFGGIEVEAAYYARGLSEINGNRVTVVTKDQGQPSRKSEHVQITPHPNLKGPGYWEKRRTLAGRLKSRLFGETSVDSADFYKTLNADLFFVQGPSPEAVIIQNFCLKNNIPFVFRLASDYDIGGANGDVSLMESWTRMKSGDVIKLITRSAVLLVQSNLQREVCLRYFNASGEIIYNPITVPKEMTHDERDIDILWVGKNTVVKRPELFIQIASELPEAKCVFVCNKVDHGTWDRLVASIPPNVELVESVPLDRIASYFARTKVFVNTSDTEGFANTFLQACVAKVPIVSLHSDPEGLLSVVGAGRVVSGDMKLAVEEIRELISNSDRHNTIGLKGWNYVMQNHESVMVIRRLYELMKSKSS